MDDELKFGARNSRYDQERIQTAHDLMVENGAVCARTKSADLDPTETYINFGGTIKAVQVDGGYRVKAPLVVFTDASDPDLTGDYFDATTDFDMEFPGKSTTYFNHGVDSHFKKQRLPQSELTKDEFAVWAETILRESDEYENFLIGLGKQGRLGMSSGVPGHLVEREQVGKATHITRWPLGKDASFTHTPAESKTRQIIPLKSLAQAAETAPVIESKSSLDKEPKVAEITFTPEEVTALKESMSKVGEMQETVAEMSKSIKEFKRAQPAIQSAGHGVSVVRDEADAPFKSLAEQCQAIKAYEMSKGRKADVRLSRLDATKASGANEGIGSEGGFLLEPTLTSEFLMPMHEEGPFTREARKLPISNNSNYGWINGVDETSRATGSRWGGIVGYRLNEGGTKTASKPAFRRINWELKKYAVVMYATDELLADAAQFSAIAKAGAGEELSFMANDDVFTGAGVGGPLGVINSGALVSVAKEAGQAAATIVNTNILKMWARVTSRSKSKATWFYNTDCGPQLHALAQPVGVAALEPRFVTYGADGGIRIFGRPGVETEFNQTLGTVGDLVCFDMSEYLMWDKTVEGATSIHVQFLTDETTFRWVYRLDGKPTIAAPLTPYRGTLTTSPFVALATRS